MLENIDRKTMLWRAIEHYRLADSTEEHIEQKEVLDNYIDDMLDISDMDEVAINHAHRMALAKAVVRSAGYSLVSQKFIIAFAEFMQDYLKGDFELPKLAEIDARAAFEAWQEPFNQDAIAQAGIKTVARNIRVTEPVTADKLLAITTAYEQGVGYGRQRYKAPNPYALWSDENGAWELGYQEGIDMEATTPQPDQGARAL